LNPARIRANLNHCFLISVFAQEFAMQLCTPVVLASSLIAFAASTAAAQPVLMPYRDGYTVHGFGDSNTHPDYVLFAGVEQIGGNLAVCGAVVFDPKGSHAKSYERKATRKVKFILGGQRIPVNTDTFRRYASIESAEADGRVGCSLTTIPWQPAFARTPLEIKAGPITVMES
jgi:hypothetical protein